MDTDILFLQSQYLFDFCTEMLSDIVNRRKARVAVEPSSTDISTNHMRFPSANEMKNTCCSATTREFFFFDVSCFVEDM